MFENRSFGRSLRSARLFSLLAALAAATAGCSTAAKPAPEPAVAQPAAPTYLFGWPFIETQGLTPRGGTTRGEQVTLDDQPSSRWLALRSGTLSPFEMDRAAILAQAGDYRTSFDFLESIVFDAPYKPAKPYRSWGTERVYVLEDAGDFISLQHVMAMVVVDEDGNRQGPFVQKHWRQDWQYQPATVLEYRGNKTFVERTLDPEDSLGAWRQSVYQVDDTPRYAALGRWEHTDSYSAWTSVRTGRPVPRRESTARDDYDLIEGVNRHTIGPFGWVHEQDNLKQVLGADIDAPKASRARELGVNRYDRVIGFDFSAADDYWRATAPFWSIVRDAWSDRLASATTLEVATVCRDVPVFVHFFQYAQKLEAGEAPASSEMQAFVDDIIDCIVTS